MATVVVPAWPQRMLIIGCGNMAGAMLNGWLAAGLAPARFTVVDPRLAAAPPGVRLLREVPAGGADTGFDTVLLGVKPQLLDVVAPAIAALAGPATIVLSILAGAELASLAARLPQAGAVVRVMPNLAAAIGQSPIILVASELDHAGRRNLQELMAPLGSPEWLDDEALFDAVTALVGSGPAFLYRFIAALAHAGAQLGLAPDQATRMALATVAGAGALAVMSDASPVELARRVTSPGGMTQAGLTILDDDDGLIRLMTATLQVTRDRGRQLAVTARQAPGTVQA